MNVGKMVVSGGKQKKEMRDGCHSVVGAWYYVPVSSCLIYNLFLLAGNEVLRRRQGL